MSDQGKAEAPTPSAGGLRKAELPACGVPGPRSPGGARGPGRGSMGRRSLPGFRVP